MKSVSQLVNDEFEAALNLLDMLIREPSVEGSAAIHRCLDIIEQNLRPLGGALRRPEYDGLQSLLCDWGDRSQKSRLLLVGHTDVVPPGESWQTPPFCLVRQDGLLTGRGVCDMKGGIAAFVAALRVVRRSGGLSDTPVSLIVTGDEEVGSERGMVPLLRDGHVRGAWAICGEPTDLAIFTGNRGVIWLRIEISGAGGHAGFAHALHNPVHQAADIVTKLHSLPLTMRDNRFEPPEPSLSVTWIQVAGEPVTNIIPDAVSLGIDRRLIPGEEPKEAIAQIQAILDQMVTGRFEARIVIDRAIPPYVTDPAEPLVAAAQRAVLDVGRPASLGTDAAADDSSWLGNAGITTVLLGPGEPLQAHATGEAVRARDLRDAIEIYARLLMAARDGQIDNQGRAA
jgi:acetylornithine deacetylase/succinyl-diaminopimelate desuccinylase-like protein